MHFHLFMAVWGNKYIDHLVSVALPSFLSGGNLPSLSNLQRSRFVFITRAIDQPRLEAAPLVQRVRAMMDIQFIHIEPERYGTVHQALTEAHQRALLEAQADKAHGIVLSPDMIMADGSLAAIDRYAARGVRAVMVSGLRLCEETAVPALKANGLLTSTNQDTLHPRALMRFALDHLHPETNRLRFDSPQFIENPVCLWPIENKGLLLRAFHLHPLMIDLSTLREPTDLRGDTIDGAFIGSSFGNWTDIHIETNSDNILLFSLSSEADRIQPGRRRRASEAMLRRVAYRRDVSPMHRWFFTRAIKLHTSDLDAHWAQLEESTGLLAFRAMDIAGLSGFALARLMVSMLREHIAFWLSLSGTGRNLLELRRRALRTLRQARDRSRFRRERPKADF